MVCVGQGIYGKVQFSDGKFPQYDRPYLVVSVTSERIGLLNVSSTAGKEHKLLFPTNKRLINFNPPFLKDSFVKLDSLTYISVSDISQFRILHGGDCLQKDELNSIIQLIS